MAGDEPSFLKTWKPIFEQYLTTAVGSLYEPPVTFSLVAADFKEEQSFARMITDGLLDFICKFDVTYSLEPWNDLCVLGQTHLLGLWCALQNNSDLCRLPPSILSLDR